MNEIEDAQKELGKVGPSLERLDEAQRGFTAEQLTKDRTFIVTYIVVLYVFSVGLTILYLVVRGWVWAKDQFANISEIIKIGVIPIVTLVVGYYFGTARR